MTKYFPPKITFVVFVTILLAVGFWAGFSFQKSKGGHASFLDEYNFAKVFSAKPTFDLLQEGVGIIYEKYAGSSQVREEDLIYGAMDGMLKALGDPHSVFFKPEDAKIFKEDVNGSFEGIGAEIGMRNDSLTVIAPLKDSPAERAGLMRGDKIRFIDERETKDITLDGAVQIIRGPKGSKVVLTISREGEAQDLKISITRETIKIPNLTWEKKEGGIAYISLFHFTDKASGDFERISDEILKSEVRSIILDLRNNPGGFLEVAVDIAGWFLQEGSVIVTEDRDGRGENKVYTSQGSGALGGYPTVVLVNNGSASASEILAGAMRDHRNVLLIGEKTFGKGSVQELMSLSDRSNIKITVAKWVTPKGTSLEGNGLEPDIKVEMTEELLKREGDIQLKKAIEVIQGL